MSNKRRRSVSSGSSKAAKTSNRAVWTEHTNNLVALLTRSWELGFADAFVLSEQTGLKHGSLNAFKSGKQPVTTQWFYRGRNMSRLLVHALAHRHSGLVQTLSKDQEAPAAEDRDKAQFLSITKAVRRQVASEDKDQADFAVQTVFRRHLVSVQLQPQPPERKFDSRDAKLNRLEQLFHLHIGSSPVASNSARPANDAPTDQDARALERIQRVVDGWLKKRGLASGPVFGNLVRILMLWLCDWFRVPVECDPLFSMDDYLAAEGVGFHLTETDAFLTSLVDEIQSLFLIPILNPSRICK